MQTSSPTSNLTWDQNLNPGQDLGVDNIQSLDVWIQITILQLELLPIVSIPRLLYLTIIINKKGNFFSKKDMFELGILIRLLSKIF